MSNTIEGPVKEKIISRLDKLNPETKQLWGKMNATQMLTHMNDAFRITLGMKEADNRSNFFRRYIMFPVAIYVLRTWPKGTPTAKELNQEKLGSTPRDFYTELEFLKKMIDIFNEREGAKLKPHPMFGRLSKREWSDLFIKHFDHHLNQFGV